MEGNNCSGRIHLGIRYYALIAFRINAEFYCTLNPIFLSCFVITAILTVARLHWLTPWFFNFCWIICQGVRFEVLVAVRRMTMLTLWVLAPCRLVGRFRRFGEKYLCLSSGKPGSSDLSTTHQTPECHSQCNKVQTIFTMITSRFFGIYNH
jgi:hypothetical protein